MRAAWKRSSGAILASLLFACGTDRALDTKDEDENAGNDTDSDNDEPKDPSADEPSVDAGVDGGAAARRPKGTIEWKPGTDTLGFVPLEFATLPVPVDPSAPGGPTLELSLVRWPTPSPDRLGVVTFNPGGPGTPLIDVAVDAVALLARLFPRFDIVLMDNRGVGASAPITCLELDRARELAGSRAEATETNEILETEKLFFSELLDACAAALGDVLPHLSTENVARDMEALRIALGEEQLSFWGSSYGSLQGLLYATLYPERVRAIILDSPVLRRSATAPNWIEVTSQVALAYEAELERFFEWCPRTNECPLIGVSSPDLRDLFDEISANLRSAIEDAATLPYDLVTASTVTLLRAGRWDVLGGLLQTASLGDWDYAQQVYNQGSALDSPQALRVLEARALLSSLDTPCPPDYGFDDALDAYTDIIQRAPRLGPSLGAAVVQCTTDVPTPAEPLVVPAALDAPGFLVISGLHDPATPHADAEALVQQLGNDSLLLNYTGEGHATALRSQCVVDAMSNFMATGLLAGLPTSCDRETAD